MKKKLMMILLSSLCLNLTACNNNTNTDIDDSEQSVAVIDNDSKESIKSSETTNKHEKAKSNDEIKPENFVVNYKDYKFWAGMTIQDIIDQNLKVKANCSYIISDLDYLLEDGEIDSEDYKEDFSNMTELLTECYAEDNYSTIYVTPFHFDEENEWYCLSPFNNTNQLDLVAHSFSEDPAKLIDCKISEIKVDSEYLASALGLEIDSNGSSVSYQALVDMIGEPKKIEENMEFHYFELSEGFWLEGIFRDPEKTKFDLLGIHINYTEDFPE